MFSRSDFWIGLAVGAVAGVFGYRYEIDSPKLYGDNHGKLRRYAFGRSRKNKSALGGYYP